MSKPPNSKTDQTETLAIFERDNTITPSKLRTIGYVPATVYGKDFAPVSFQIKTHEFQLALARGVRTFKLEGAGLSQEVQVQQLQKSNVKEQVLHAEFYVPGKVASKKSLAHAAKVAEHAEQMAKAAESASQSTEQLGAEPETPAATTAEAAPIS